MLPLTTAQIVHLTQTVDPEFTRFNNKTSLHKRGGFREHTIGNAIAFQDLKIPKSTYYNRVVGFSEADLPLLPDIESLYRDEAAIDCLISLPPYQQSPKLLTALYDRGFHYIGSDYNFVLEPKKYEPIAIPDRIEVRKVNEDSLDVLFDLMRDSGAKFDAGALSSSREQFCRKPIEFYIAYVDGVAAGRASVIYCEGVAWLNNAETDVRYRGLGCHAALLNARISSARDEGCSLVFSDAEFGSISHRNMTKCGFQLGFTSAELLKSYTD